MAYGVVAYPPETTTSTPDALFAATITLSYPIINGFIRYIDTSGQCWVGDLEAANSENELTLVRIQDYSEPKTFVSLATAITAHNTLALTYGSFPHMVTCPNCNGGETGAACLNQILNTTGLSRCLHTFVFGIENDQIGDALVAFDSADAITTRNEAWAILEGKTVILDTASNELGVEI